MAGSPGGSPGEKRLPEGCWRKGELDGDLVGHGARDGDKTDARRKGGWIWRRGSMAIGWSSSR